MKSRSKALTEIGTIKAIITHLERTLATNNISFVRKDVKTLTKKQLSGYWGYLKERFDRTRSVIKTENIE